MSLSLLKHVLIKNDICSILFVQKTPSLKFSKKGKQKKNYIYMRPFFTGHELSSSIYQTYDKSVVGRTNFNKHMFVAQTRLDKARPISVLSETDAEYRLCP